MAESESPWWTRFFAGAWGELQLAGYPPERTRAEVDFIERSLALAPGSRVLDLPCGEGRHSIELAARGHRPCGVDLSERAIEAARQRAQERGVTVDFRTGDMRHFTDPAPFDAAICYFGSFGYFSDEENAESARRMAAALRPGGKLIIDGHVAETLFPRFRPHDWAWEGEPPDGLRILEERRWDHDTGRTETTWTFVSGQSVRSEHSSIRIYTYRELKQLLAAAGFRELRGYDPRTGAEFQMGAARLAIVATR